MGNEERITAGHGTAHRPRHRGRCPATELRDRAQRDRAVDRSPRNPKAIQGTVRAIWESLEMPRTIALHNGLSYTQIGNSATGRGAHGTPTRKRRSTASDSARSRRVRHGQGRNSWRSTPSASFEEIPGTALDLMREYDLATARLRGDRVPRRRHRAARTSSQGERGEDGRWDVAPGAEAPFRTRIVVRRRRIRADSAASSSWSGTTCRPDIDAAPDWGFFHRHLAAAGPRLGRRLGAEGRHRRRRVRRGHPPQALGPRTATATSSTQATRGASTSSPRSAAAAPPARREPARGAEPRNAHRGRASRSRPPAW